MALCLPELSSRWARVRGLLLSVVLIAAFAHTSSTWLDAAPHLRRAHLQIAAVVIALLVVTSAARLRIPRWSFLALAAAVWIGCLIAGANVFVLFLSLFALILLAGTAVGAIAAHWGSRRDGDIAMAMIVGYAIGQWIPRML